MVFTFQTTGGYYSDNVYSTTSVSTSTTNGVNDAGKTGSITINSGTAPAVGSYVVGLGVQSYTTVSAHPEFKNGMSAKMKVYVNKNVTQ